MPQSAKGIVKQPMRPRSNTAKAASISTPQTHAQFSKRLQPVYTTSAIWHPRDHASASEQPLHNSLHSPSTIPQPVEGSVQRYAPSPSKATPQTGPAQMPLQAQ